MPTVDPAFEATPNFQKLSDSARAALSGMAQFAIMRHGDWITEGTPAQIGAWVGPESGMGAKRISNGVVELEAAGMIKRVSMAGRQAGYSISARLKH